jgi:hypothetical protein
MNTNSSYFLLNGKEILHNPILIIATMNTSTFSKNLSSLSIKLQSASYFQCLKPFNENELEYLQIPFYPKMEYNTHLLLFLIKS